MTPKAKVTVLNVCLDCDKCKVKLLKAVASLEGVNKIETDDEKGTLTVTGEVDPHELIGCVRKVGTASIVSVGDPKKPDDEKKDDCTCNICCPDYSLLPFKMPTPYPYSYSYQPTQPSCSIM